MNKATMILLAFLMALSLTGCATAFQQSRTWVEEVKLSDGRVINVEREDFIDKQLGLVARSTLKFKLESGKEVIWASCARPSVLEFVGNKYYVVASARFSFCTTSLRLPYSGGIAAWALDGKTIERISNEATPRSLRPNLVSSGTEPAKRGFVRHAEKRGELNVDQYMNWCIDAWTERGDLTKCSNEGSK